MLDTILDILLDALKDTAKLIPFLFLTYLLMEFIEHKAGDKAGNAIRKSGKFGPLFGGLLGIVPQCGFSAAASNLYAGRIITLGTLMAIFLSTSDEMLPIMISSSVEITLVLKILLSKLIIGIAAGFIIDLALSFIRKPADGEIHIHELCEHGHCHCEKGIVRSAILHTLEITAFIFAFSLLIGSAVELVGEERISEIFVSRPVVGELIAGLIGLIPNCASSVVITQLYLDGLISLGSLMSGLLVGAGVGLMVLFRVNKKLKENLMILALLYFCGIFFGLFFEIPAISALF